MGPLALLSQFILSYLLYVMYVLEPLLGFPYFFADLATLIRGASGNRQCGFAQLFIGGGGEKRRAKDESEISLPPLSMVWFVLLPWERRPKNKDLDITKCTLSHRKRARLS